MNSFANDIAFVGLAGSGKDTAAVPLLELGWKPASFAFELKMLCATLGWNGQKDDKGRRLLQEIGCTARDYDPQVWINKARQRFPVTLGSFVWTDVRFQNEADMIRERGGVLILVTRPSLEMSDIHKHQSETSISRIQCDYEVVNDGSVVSLHEQVRELLQCF